MLKSIKFISILLAILIACSLGVAAKEIVNIKKGSVIIDGQIDDIWQYAEQMDCTGLSAGEMTDATAYAKMLWDDENLYILFVATDNTRFEKTEGQLHRQDCYEVFFDLDNKKTETYSEPNQFRFLYDIITPLETGMRNLDNIAENPLQYIEIAGVETATGYVMEARINYKIGLNNFKLVENMLIGIDFGYDDNTTGENVRTGQQTWNADGAEPSGNPSLMGTIRLINVDGMPQIEEPEVEAPAETTPPTTTAPTAPQTGDAFIVLLAVLGVSGLGVTFIAKRRKV
ncbi:MAG: CBM9 family sugar-binding protein [Oscillospiraceae bacterium]|nr:CBM9 family sugar-binding protein [Oscillospiraceae bacterium]